MVLEYKETLSVLPLHWKLIWAVVLLLWVPIAYTVAAPVLGPLRLSDGGAHECQYALHFAAGFGSQVTYILYRR